MRKKYLTIALCMALSTVMIACAGGGNNTENTGDSSTEQSSQSASADTGYDGVRSFGIKVDFEKQITELSDYNGIEITLVGDYEITDDMVRDSAMEMLSYYGAGTIEVTDLDIVQEGDYVKIDYVSYKDDVAFEGGTASDIMMDVSNNMDVTNPTYPSPYIEGFCKDLVGAKVGDVLRTDVTFPENYSEPLAGQPAVFEITVKGIYRKATWDNIDDDTIASLFSSSEINTKEEFLERMRGALGNQVESAKSQEKINAAQNYILSNSKVEIPQEYMDARLAEYEYSTMKDVCSPGQTLEEYFLANGTTLEAQRESWNTALTNQIKVEFLFGRIADLENIEVDEEDFSKFVDYMMQSANGKFAAAEDLYRYYGIGDDKDGEAMLRQLYRANKAVNFVVDHANITTESD